MEDIKKINKNIEKHFTASALVINKECKILLVNHKKLGVWLYPGGHVEDNETPDETVIRETKEETGLGVEIISDKDENLTNGEANVFVLHQPYAILCEKIKSDPEHYHIDLIYRCRIINENFNKIIKDFNIEEVNFFRLNDLNQINLFPNFRKLLEKALKKNC